jgi:hypothetical protein
MNKLDRKLKGMLSIECRASWVEPKKKKKNI